MNKKKFKLKDETTKFNEDVKYHSFIKKLKKTNISTEDILQHFPAYSGHVNLSRILTFYEIYKKVLGINGHIAEIGVWKGASFLLFAKLIKIFEPYSNTIVHGFDNFEGMKPSTQESKFIKNKSYISSFAKTNNLIKDQSLSNIAKIHKIDVTKDLSKFSNTYKSTCFKLVFFDCGTYEVVNSALPFFWERLLPGGIMLFDQFNYEVAHGETIAVRNILKNQKMHTISWTRSPSGYIIK